MSDPDAYLIDGYNLIHALGFLDRQKGAGVLELSRQRLFDFLLDSFAGHTDRVTIVFDAQHAPRHVSRQQSYRGLHIVFAPRHQTADDVIETLIEEHKTPHLLAVISNDSRLKSYAQRRGSRAWTHTELLDFLDKRRTKTPDCSAAVDEKQADPMSRAEKDHWLKEFEALESDPELKEFLTLIASRTEINLALPKSDGFTMTRPLMNWKKERIMQMMYAKVRPRLSQWLRQQSGNNSTTR